MHTPVSVRRSSPRLRRLAAALAVAFLVGACGLPEGANKGPRTDGNPTQPGALGTGPSAPVLTESPSATSSGDGSLTAQVGPAVAAPGPLDDVLHSADLLVYAGQSFTPGDLKAIGSTPGVTATLPLSLAQAGLQERVVTVAAVNPGEYRRWTPRTSATLHQAWERVAGGEMAAAQDLDRKMLDAAGNLPLGNESGVKVHVGAWLPQVPRIDLMVNEAWIPTLGMLTDNAVLVSTGLTAPQETKKRLQALVGDGVSVQLLGPDLDTTAVQTALLTGGDVSQAIGTFTYTVLGGGRILPDPAWSSANIRTETVPILGRVTCHKVMLPQLRAALTEVVQRGLASTIHPGEYAGCYYPRFIAGSTSLSNHSFGTALDLNVPGNQRGTVGEMDRQVVAIFKKWGFGWGGDWNWTDPMHFELNRLVAVG